MEYKKVCLRCGKEYTKPYYTGKPEWSTRKYCSHKCKYGKGEDSITWKGDKIQVDSLHSKISREWEKPKQCEICGTETAKTYNWSNKDHTYTRNREDWQYLCKKCHTHYDMKNNGYNPASHLRRYWEGRRTNR